MIVFLLLSASCKKEQVGALSTEIASPTTYQLMDVKFISHYIGYACGGKEFEKSELIRTLDGGETWQIIPLAHTNAVRTLFALDALPNGTLHVVGSAGATYHSTDYGFTLKFEQEPFWRDWRGIFFRTKDEVVICSQENFGTGSIRRMKTTDNWQDYWDYKTHSMGMYDVNFADQQHGYIAGFGAIYKTTDGGDSWTFTDAKDDYFTATEWFSANEGVAIGWEGTILRTENGGETWEYIRKGNKAAQKKIRLKGLAQNNSFELVAVGEKGCMIYSKDRGRTWFEFGDFTDVNLEAVSFTDNDTFFAVGAEGRIFKLQF